METLNIIEVFKTNVEDNTLASRIINDLKAVLPGTKINFDLDDCDKILRIESGKPIDVKYVESHFKNLGYNASTLE